MDEIKLGEHHTATVRGDVIDVELYYLRSGDRPQFIEVGIVDVRAADSIRITYDFDRDGYVVLQASVFEWDADDPNRDSDWQEVAFIRAWGRERNTNDR